MTTDPISAMPSARSGELPGMHRHGFKLTKLAGDGYSIHGTGLHVAKAARARYGKSQEWDVVNPSIPDRALVTGTSLADACYRLSELKRLL